MSSNLTIIVLICVCRASDRVRKKITKYAEIFRNIMRKKVLIMRKTRWIMRKIFGSLRSPKITSFHAAEIELPQKPRVCSQATNCGRFARWYVARRPVCSLKLASLNSSLVQPMRSTCGKCTAKWRSFFLVSLMTNLSIYYKY